MGLFDLKCVKCGGAVKPKEVKFVLSKSTGKIYQSIDAYTMTENKLTDYSVYCDNCGKIEKIKYEEVQGRLKEMLITTTALVDGLRILEYKGIVTAQVFMGVNIFRDIFSGIRDIVGGRSKSMEAEFNKAKNILVEELSKDAAKFGANAIIGLKIDFEDVGKTSGNAFMLLGTGTAVVLEGKIIK